MKAKSIILTAGKPLKLPAEQTLGFQGGSLKPARRRSNGPVLHETSLRCGGNGDSAGAFGPGLS